MSLTAYIKHRILILVIPHFVAHMWHTSFFVIYIYMQQQHLTFQYCTFHHDDLLSVTCYSSYIHSR